MAIESAVKLRKVARFACLIVIIGLLSSVAAVAQLPISAPAPVTAGSLIPFSHGSTGVWNQIYSMKIDHYGNIVYLDSANSNIFQLAPGATAPTLLIGHEPGSGATASDCSLLEYAGSYWNAAVAFDAANNLYVTDRYGTVRFCKYPYVAANNTWQISANGNWTANGPKIVSGGTTTAISPQDLQVGDDGTFYVSWSSTGEIDKFQVDPTTGNAINVTQVVTGLKEYASNIAIDHAGNLFFLENTSDSNSNEVPGILEIPVGKIPANGGTPIVGGGDGKLEAGTLDSGTVIRVDVPDASGGPYDGIKGITFDQQGNLYVGMNSPYADWNGLGQVQGLFMIPNAGTAKAPKLMPANMVMVAPYAANSSVVLDPRGFIWMAQGGSSNVGLYGTTPPTCNSSGTTAQIDATCEYSSMIIWKPGALNLGSTPVGTPTVAQPLDYVFSQATTPAKIQIVGPDAAAFTITTTNPYPTIPVPTSPAPVSNCTAGVTYPAPTSMENSSGAFSYCELFVVMNPTTAGLAQAEVQFLDANNKVIPGSSAMVSGIGLAPAASVLETPATVSIASGLNEPMQVAADYLGNTYVADAGLAAIEMYAAGSTTAAIGKSVGSSMTAPTGVAVDGAGNVYVGDSGKVIEIPMVNGALAASKQAVLASGFGNKLNLAVDGMGDVFVADYSNKQVVEIQNPQTDWVMSSGVTTTVLAAGTTFTGPSAIATDNLGNVWVADGSNLYEISMPFGGVAQQIKGAPLASPVTGLAIDPSGSVLVAQATGLLWIPATATGLNINSPVILTSGFGANNAVAPFSVAVDANQNIYADYGSSTTAGLTQIGISGNIALDSFGEVNPNSPFEADAVIFNMGNAPLTLSAFAGDTITGTNASEYSVGAASQNSPSCGPTVNTPAASSCYLGLTILALAAGERTASTEILSNAVNAPTGLNIAMSANVQTDPRPASATAVKLTPASGVSYPGTVTITVTVTSAAGTPTGSVIVTVPGSGSQSKQTGTLNASGVATFTYKGLNGGSYNLLAVYGGAGTGGTTANSCSPTGSACFAGSAAPKTTFVVNTVAPVLSVGAPGCASASSTATCTLNPNNVTVWAGNTFVQSGKSVNIPFTVTSTIGTPTGTVRFLVNNKPVDPSQDPLPLSAQTLSLSGLAVGTYNVTAVYSGDTNFSTVSYALPTFIVTLPRDMITSTPASLTITPGTPVTATLSIKPLVSFSASKVLMQCVAATLPPYSECTFDNPIPAVGQNSDPTSPSSVVVTISSNVPVNGGTSSSVARTSSWTLAGIFGLGLMGIFVGRRKLNRYLTILGFAVLMSGGLMGITSCTNSGYSTPLPAPVVTTPAGTYNVQIITTDSTGLQNSLASPVFVLPVTVN
jgi:hypothetical protein